MVEFGVLGPLEVRFDGVPRPLGGPRQRALLGMLLCDANRVVSRDRLIEELVGREATDRPDNVLRVQVSRLRKVLADGDAEPRLIARFPGYLLRVEPGELDLHRFEYLARAGAQASGSGDHGRAAAVLREAEGLWRGRRALADLEFESFARPEIDRLEELRLGVVERRVDAELALGRHAELVAELEELAGEWPLRERFRAQLLLALYRCGRQTDALEAYRRARDHLVDDFGLEPGEELRDLQAQILRHDPRLRAPEPERTSVSLPSRGVTIIGREGELDEIASLLGDPAVSLLTLTGTGGIGKTTLALEAARRAAHSFHDGADVVWLASLVSEQQVLTELARVLGIELTGQETALVTLTRVLARQQRLVVLDNLEHLLGAAPSVAQLAGDCPRVKLLVTSRAPLRVGLERVLQVQPLAVPVGGVDTSAERLRATAAGALFVERARTADPHFALLEPDVEPVSELCRYLGGVPLALELAAARTAVLAPQAILERVRASAELLGPARRDAPDRHHTLHATIDWSYQLLNAGERTLFTRLAVFASGFTADGAEAVGGDLELSVVDGLQVLLDHGLIHRANAREGARFAMLEPIRAHALGLLRAGPGYDDVSDRCARYHATFAAQASAGLRTHDQLRWLDRLDEEQANLRAILQAAQTESQIDVGLLIAAALAYYWPLRDLSPELVPWLTRALDARPDGDGTIRAWALYALGFSAQHIGELEQHVACLQACLAICEAHPHSRLEACCEAGLAFRFYHRGKLDEALVHRTRALALAGEVDEPVIRAIVLVNVAGCIPDARVDAQAGYRDARTLIGEADQLFESVGSRSGRCYAKHGLGSAAWLAGDFAAARTHLQQALAHAEAIRAPGQAAWIRLNLGLAELGDRRTAEARAQLSAAVVGLIRGGNTTLARNAMTGLAALAAREGAADESARVLDAAQLLSNEPRTITEGLLYDRYLRDIASPGPNNSRCAELDAILEEIGQDAAAHAGELASA